MQTGYDVVVLGGGPAGLAAAIAIRRQIQARVLVADAGPALRERFGESASGELLIHLDRLGLLEQFRTGPHMPCPGSASIWGGGQIGYNDYILSPHGPAWRLQRAAFDGLLVSAARAAGVDLRWEMRFLHGRPAAGGHLLALRSARGTHEVTAGLVVDATGPAARFATRAGARRLPGQRLYAIARYAGIRAGAMTMQTLLEADRDGWWYAVRLPDQRVLALFVGDAAALRRLRADDHGAFEHALSATRLVGPALGGLALGEKVYHTTTITTDRLDCPAGEGWLAVGDAAASYDPIIAWGLTKALEDGVMAGRQIAQGPGRAERYVARMEERFHTYASIRARLYALERRDGPFWQRCRAALA
ncbi:MAG: tryptophan 7-halogenase [Roseiflexaceae bacterium]